MKPIILSFRSARFDPLPFWIVQELLPKIRIPLTVCLEHDSAESLNHLIEDYTNKLNASEKTLEQLEYEKSIFWLLKTIKQQKVRFVSLENPEVSLKKVATQYGGVIIDLGNVRTLPAIQASLTNEPIHSHFFCVYSKHERKDELSPFRLMRFAGVPKKLLPAGLTFLTTHTTESQWKQESAQRQALVSHVQHILTRYDEKPLFARLGSFLTHWIPKYAA